MMRRIYHLRVSLNDVGDDRRSVMNGTLVVLFVVSLVGYERGEEKNQWRAVSNTD